MREGYHGGIRRTRRRSSMQNIAPLARSQSLEAVSIGSVNRFGSSTGDSGSARAGGVGYGTKLTANGNDGQADNLRAPHLPPLGRKLRRYSGNVDTLVSLIQPQTTSAAKQKRYPNRRTDLPPPVPSAPPTSIPTYGTKLAEEDTRWTTTTDVVVGASETAGIVFRWVETATMAGLRVVQIVDASVATRHGQVFPGMILVAINHIELVSLSQEETTWAMRESAGQPRVLTLGIRAVESSPAPSQNPATELHGGRVAVLNFDKCDPEEIGSDVASSKGRSGNRGRHDEKLVGLGEQTTANFSPERVSTPQTTDMSSRSSTIGFFSTNTTSSNARRSLPAASASCDPPSHNGVSFDRRSSSGASNKDLWSTSATSASDYSNDVSSVGGDSITTWSSSTICSTSKKDVSAPGGWGGAPSREFRPGKKCDYHHEQQQQQPPPPPPEKRKHQEKILALRFVGSRGISSLFDRDHVLGLKKLDIEFVVSSGLRSEAHRANSRRSLGELTRDWRNDPCSTPARRRRLINDVCKVVVRSYTTASVERVTEFRRQEAVLVKIQAVARIRAARQQYAAMLARRRAQAALCLQLAWLAFLAKRTAWALRQERDRSRRAEEAMREKELRREMEENRQREEARLNAEKTREECARQRRIQELIVFLQRRVRSRQERRHTMIRAECQRKSLKLQKNRAAIVVQTAYRVSRKTTRRRNEVAEAAAAAAAAKLIQRAWRRQHNLRTTPAATKTRKNMSPLLFAASDKSSGDSSLPDRFYLERGRKGSTPGVCIDKGAGDVANVDGAYDFLRPRVKEDRRAVGWGGWAQGNTALMMEVAKEDGQDDIAEAIGEEETRPWTSSATVGSTCFDGRIGSNPKEKPPPAGMMTVRVKIGQEETSLVTPIVVAENDVEAAEKNGFKSYEDRKNDITDEYGDGVPNNVLSRDGSEVQQSPQAARFPSNCAEAQAFLKVNENKLVSEWAKEKSGATEFVLHTNAALLRSPSTGASAQHVSVLQRPDKSGTVPNTHESAIESEINSGRLAHGMKPLPVPRALASLGGGNASLDLALTSPRLVPGLEDVNAAAGTVLVARREIEAADNVMEDSQVYLGCSFCGVKYLVEAVDARLPDSSEGQPAPEVVYLCTRCGGTLRNGKDGRWRRRRRPSSAPATTRRRQPMSSFLPSSSNNLSEKGISWDLDGDGRGPDNCESNVGGFVADARALEESAAKLRYSWCARRIQHAYGDFRHRQYLRDWALSLLRRWLRTRVQVRRCARLRLRRRRAVVTLQAVFRAISARTRCRSLSDARLRRWLDCAAAVRERNCYRPSPVEEELWKDRTVLNRSRSPTVALSSLESDLALGLSVDSSEAKGAHYSVDCGSARRSVWDSSCEDSSSRALAEALAPRMGIPPPGCPGPLEVDWGHLGAKLQLKFPPVAWSNNHVPIGGRQ